MLVLQTRRRLPAMLSAVGAADLCPLDFPFGADAPSVRRRVVPGLPDRLSSAA